MTIVAEQLELVRQRLGVDEAAWLVVSADRTAADMAAGKPRPRYVWVPTRDRFGPPTRAGGNPRQLYTRLAGLELHLWTDSQDDGETRLHDVIRAWHLEASGSVTFEVANWHESPVNRGFLVTLEIRVAIPVLDAPKPVARATKLAPDPAGIAHGDGNLDSGEST